MVITDSMHARLIAATLGCILSIGCNETNSDASSSGGAQASNGDTTATDAEVPSGLMTNTNQGGAAPTPVDPTTKMTDQGPASATPDMAVTDMTIPDMIVAPDADTAMPTCTRDFECNDNNPCTDDVCENGECVNTNNEAPCDDGVYCNGAEACSEGICRLGPIPCPSPEECAEDTKTCTACDNDEQCPEAEVQSRSPCTYADRCIERGEQTQQVREYSCQNRECVADIVARETVCERESNALPCGGGFMCVDGVCPRPPLVKAVSSGFPNFNARLFVRCQENNQQCVVVGNRDRADRGSMNLSCEILCPTGSQVEICCSNGSRPCVDGRIIAPNATVRIQSLTTEAFTADTCVDELGGVNEARCSATVGEADAILNCRFDR